MNAKAWLENTRLKYGVWKRERAEKAEERRARMVPGAAPFVWCLFITFVGIFTLLGSTWLFTVFIAGSVGHLDWFSDYQATESGVSRWVWNFEAAIHWLPAIGLWAMCLGIGIFNACWIELRKHFSGAFRNWITGLGLATALFMVAGGVAMQQRGTDARTRDEAAAVGAAQAGVAALDAELVALERRWETLCAPNLTTWQAQACRSGETAWQDRIEIARQQYRENDPQYMIIARAIADAREGDRMQARLAELRGQRAAASVQTVQAETATVRADGWMASLATLLEDLRKPIASILGELLAMSAFSMALNAWASRRPYSVPSGASGWADEGLQIEDKRAEDSIGRNSYIRDTGTFVRDAKGNDEIMLDEDGAPLKEVRYWKREDGRPLVKNRPQQVNIQPDIPESETGVTHDGGNRIAVGADGLGGVMESAIPEKGEDSSEDSITSGHRDGESDKQDGDRDREREEAPQGEHADFGPIHSEPSEPEMSEDELREVYPELAAEERSGEEPEAETNQAEAEEENQRAAIHHEPREPETNPARLLAAE